MPKSGKIESKTPLLLRQGGLIFAWKWGLVFVDIYDVFAVFDGAHARVFFEYAVEVAKAVVGELIADFQGAGFCVSQQGARVVDF